MQKTSLKLYEYYNLETELNGSVDAQNGEILSTGLLTERLKLTSKYWIYDLSAKVVAEKAAIEKMKSELVQKHGSVDEQGNFSITRFINVERNEAGEFVSGDNNPKYVDFQNDFNTILNEEKEIEHKQFKLEDFENVETNSIYPTFFKLINAGE